MRALALLLAALCVVPSASAAAFDLGRERIVEAALRPGEDVTLAMPLLARQNGSLYAKVLPTPGSALNDGTRANGSAEDGTGWRATFAFVRADGSREELGTFVDSTATRLVAVTRDEAITFEATLHVPAEAARGGPSQRVFVAVAYRATTATTISSGASGASLDEARALTLLLTDALLPPATQDDTDAADELAPEEDATPGVPPVAPIATTTGNVHVTMSFPSWFLFGVVAALLLLAGAVIVQALILSSWARRAREAAPPRAEPVRRVELEHATETEKEPIGQPRLAQKR